MHSRGKLRPGQKSYQGFAQSTVARSLESWKYSMGFSETCPGRILIEAHASNNRLASSANPALLLWRALVIGLHYNASVAKDFKVGEKAD